ncbi:hypothetical protein [Ekhidna sp.]
MKKLLLGLVVLVGCTQVEVEPELNPEIVSPASSVNKTINDIDPAYNNAINITDYMSLGLTATQAIDSAISDNKSIYFPNGTYSIDKTIEFLSTAKNSHYLGETKHGVVWEYNVTDPTLRMADIRADSVKFENITFSGNNRDVGTALLEVGAFWDTVDNIDNVHFSNCIIKDIKSPLNVDTYDDEDNNYGMRITLGEVWDFSLDGIEFKNITAVNTDTAAGAGFAGGLLLWSNVGAETFNRPLNGYIQNCKFSNIYTEQTGGNINYSDADGIRVFASNSQSENITVPFNLNFIDNTFEGVEKSAIKISAGKGINITNTIIKSTSPNPNDSLPDMISGIRIQPAIDVDITNTQVEGSFKFVVNLIGQDITVDGISKYNNNYEATALFDGGSAIVQIQKDYGIDNKNIVVKNIEDGYVRKVFKLRSDTLGRLDESITLSNVNLNGDMTYYNNLGGGNGRIDIVQAKDVLLENVDIIDWSTGTRPIVIIDSEDINISGGHYYAKEVGIETRFTSDPQAVKNIEIDNVVFKRGDHSSSNLRFAYLRPLSTDGQTWGAIDRVSLTNTSFYAHGFDAQGNFGKGNQEAVFIGADEIEIDNVQIYYTPETGQYLPNSGMYIRDASKVSVIDVTLDTNPVYAGGIYALYAFGCSDSDGLIDINNITSTNNGVWLKQCVTVGVAENNITCPGIKLLEQ